MFEVKIMLKSSKKVVGNIDFESMDILRSYFKENSNERFTYFMDIDGNKVKIE